VSERRTPRKQRSGAKPPKPAAISHQLWGGRFAGAQHPALQAVNRSIDTDHRLWPFDIRLSKAWASSLVGVRVLTRTEATRIRRGLDRVGRKIATGVKSLPSDEDVHTLIDRLLHEEVGTVASRLHTGRSRNDQVATASRLYVMHALRAVESQVAQLQQVCLTRAESLVDDVMPAYTHLQRAQPVSVAHWMLAHFWAFNRDRERMASARASAGTLPLGSGAIAGSAFRVDRSRLARKLGFHSVSPNSIDAVGDRDFMVEALAALSLLTTHLSRLAEDLILFGSSEFGFVRFGDAFSTGSSMMPQKRNADALELARSSPARVGGHLVTMLAMLKGTPSGYNKDFQEDKRAVFDAFDAVSLLLPAVSGTIGTLSFDRNRMRAAVSCGMMATDLADFLVRRGVTFRAAHAAVGALVRQAEFEGVELDALSASAFRAAHDLLTPDSRRELDPVRSIKNRNVAGGTGPVALRAQIAMARRQIR
jgi:argininosuccinate lyase